MSRRAARSTQRICWWNWSEARHRVAGFALTALVAALAGPRAVWQSLNGVFARGPEGPQRAGGPRRTWPDPTAPRIVADACDFPLRPPPPSPKSAPPKRCGRSSGVEHNLAKVRVGRSNRLARSNSVKDTPHARDRFGGPFAFQVRARRPASPITRFAPWPLRT